MIITNLTEGRKVMRRFNRLPWFAYDTETKGKNAPLFKLSKEALIWGRQDIILWSICYKGESYSFPTSKLASEYPSMLQWADLLRPAFMNRRVIKVCHNANYDFSVSSHYMLPLVPHNIWDTMFGAWLVDLNREKGLKDRAVALGRYISQTKSVDFSDLEALGAYAENDVIVTDELFQAQHFGKISRPKTIVFFDGSKIVNPMPEDKLEVDVPGEELKTAFDKMFLKLVELPVLKSVLRAQRNGVGYDLKRDAELCAKIDKDVQAAEKVIFRSAGRVLNLNAPKQLVSLLTDLGVPIPGKTKTGAPSVNAESLFFMKGSHPIIDELIAYRTLSKQQTTYLSHKGLQSYVNPDTGRIHCSLNSLGARTGRFSSSSPNLQQVPSAKDVYGIKKNFRAGKGRKLICLDYAQMEIRMMNVFAQDPLMTQVLCDPEGDIHTTTATRFGVVRDPVAKFCNFNLQYAGGGYMLARIITLAGVPTSPRQGDEYKNQYNSHYYRIPEFREEMYAFHRKHGWFPMITGRKISVHNLDSTNKRLRHKAETQLANNIIQGCLTDNSILLVDKLGSVPIIELVRAYQKGTRDMSVWSGSAWERVTDAFEVGNKPLYEVILSDGSSYEVSDTHLWKNELGEWVDTKSLNPGDFIQQSVAPNLENFNVKDLVTEHEAEFIGMLIGDGNYSCKSVTMVIKKDKQIATHQVELATRTFGINGWTHQTKGQNKPRIHLCARFIPKLRSIGLKEGAKSYLKELPPCIFASSLKVRHALIRGYFLTDGGTSGTAAVFNSVSPELMRGFQRLLYSVGIRSKIADYPSSEPNFKHVYRLLVKGIDKAKLYDIVSDVDCAKVRRLYRISRPSKTNKGDALPPRLAERVGKEWAASFPSFGSKIKTGNTNINAMLHKFLKGTGSASYAKGIDALSAATKELLNYSFLQVVSVRNMKTAVPMYDLTVEPSNQYVLANGAVVHNSSQDYLKCGIVRTDPMCINPDAAALKLLDQSEEHEELLNEYAKKLVGVRKLLKQSRTKWLLQVHDEMLWETDAHAAYEVASVLGDVLTWTPYFEPIVKFCVPICVDGGVADTWGDAKGKTPDHKVEVRGTYYKAEKLIKD